MADLQGAAINAATQAGIDPDWYTSLIGNGEGGFANPGAVSPKGARGPAQLMPKTAASVGVTDIDDPTDNLNGGARYARMLMDRYGGDQTLATAAYNAGPGVVDHYGGVPPFPETQKYVGRVMNGVAPSQADLSAAFSGRVAQPNSPAGPPPTGGTANGPPPSQDELAAAFAPAMAPTAAPKATSAAPDWFAAQNASRNARYAAEAAAARAAPLPSVPGAIGDAWNSNVSGLQTDLANMFKPPVYQSGPTGKTLTDNPFLDAIGHAAGAVAAPITGAVDALYTSPVSKVTGLPKAFVGQSLNALGPEAGGPGRVTSFAGPVRPTTSIPTLVGRGASSAAGAAVRPFAARFIPGAAESQAGATLAGAASDPAAVRASLAGGPDVTVPGSIPTTFQQTGDMGLGALERGVSVKNSAPFMQRAADQNAARVQALGGIQAGGDPMAVQAQVKGALDDLDAQTQAHIDALTQQAQTAGSLLGGTGVPEDYGVSTRDLVNTAENAARARESGLWQAVDPDGTLTGNTVATSDAAKQIASSMPPTAKPMSGEEAGIFNTAANLQPVAPVRDLIALRSRLSTEMRNEAITNGRSPTLARLTQLRGAIQDNLAGSISDAVQASNAQVARGVIPPEASVGAQLNDYFGSFGPQGGRDNASLAAGAGSPAGGPSGLLGPYGANGPPSWGPVGAPRIAGVPAALGAARSDVAAANAGQTGGLFRAMQELGGVKLRNPDGSLVPGPDVSATLDNVRAPGVVNNASGLPPERMAQALHERGFFGQSVTDPSSAFESAVADHAAGRSVYPQGAYEPGTAERIAQTQREQSAAGVTRFDRPEVAAAKLANYRAGVSDLLNRAEAYGVPHVGRDLNDVWGDVAEREAIQGPPEVDPHLAEFDRLSAAPRIRPTFDAGAAQRLQAATAATKARAATFGQQPIVGITRRAGSADQFRLADGRVPGRFFHPGPTGYTDMQALLNANPKAAPVIEDYAASTLRRAAMNPDGTLDPGKFAKWAKDHKDAIRALSPSAQTRFGDAARATEAVTTAAVARAQALKAGQAGALGKMIGAQSPEEVTGRVGQILGSPTRVSDMDALARATASNPDARAGLRQAVADHINQRFIGNTEAGTSGIGIMRADPFQTFMRTNATALGKVFTPAEVDSMQAIAADIARSKRSQSALKLPGGSNSPQDFHAAGLLHDVGHGGLSVIGTLLGETMGEHLAGGWGGAVGGAIGGFGTGMVKAMRAQGIAKVDDLVTRAMLDPTVAKALLQKAPKGAITPKSMQGTVILRALAGTALGSSQPPRRDEAWRNEARSAPRGQWDASGGARLLASAPRLQTGARPGGIPGFNPPRLTQDRRS